METICRFVSIGMGIALVALCFAEKYPAALAAFLGCFVFDLAADFIAERERRDKWQD